MTKTAVTPREIDAKLAEAIGCSVEWFEGDFHCGCGGHIYDDTTQILRGGDHCWTYGDCPTSNLLPYYSAPTWETSGQLIEGLAAKWNITIFVGLHTDNGGPSCAIDGGGEFPKIFHASGPSAPEAIAEAARLALGVEAPS